MNIRIMANGKPYDVADDLSVTGFLRERGLDPKYVVVEHNGEPLERRSYEGTRLRDGDRLELVRAVAGGAPESRRERLERARLYVVSDARSERGDLAGFLDTVLGAGVEIIQLREKNAEAGDLLRWGKVFSHAATRHGALFIVNDRPDVALALGADGVHLGQNDLPPALARSILGPEAIIGLSTHTAAEADAASPEADYVTAGPVWQTPTKPGRPAVGLQHVRHVAARERRPWFAIGGIKPDNLAGVVEAGARRIAVVRAITEAPEPAGAVRQLLEGLPEVSGARS